MDDLGHRWSAEMRARIVCLPSSDREFAGVVAEVLASAGVTGTVDLEERLRPAYPKIRVRACELSGEPRPTWYVYRDRDFPGATGAIRGPRLS